MKTFAIHQPNYLPYLGYFYKMAQCDIFVYLDSVQYPRGQSFAARNRIKTSQGAHYLTIPVKVPKEKEGKAKYFEIEYADDKWKRKHLNTIRRNYSRALYFDEIYSLYESVIQKKQTFLENNIELIEKIASYLSISCKRIKLSELLPQFGKKTELICEIGKKLQASHYLSGTGGGKDYNDPVLMLDNGITLLYSDFKHPQYTQLYGEFVSHLSILDVLFNVGKNAINFTRR